MLTPPPLKNLPQYPITASVSLLALVVTGAWWSGWDIALIVANGRVWSHWELWRSLTSTLPHVNVFHLAFNLYWFWVFGTLVERVYGHLKFAAIILLVAAVSMLAEFALSDGGVGLSGVGYGLWSLLWVLDRRDPRFHGAMDRQTSQAFIGWFFLCIVLTVTNVMPVANIAHAMGAAVGAMLGLVVTCQGLAKMRVLTALVAVTVLAVLGSTLFWPWINLSHQAEPTVELAGLEALAKSQNLRAIRLLELAVRMHKAPARAWYNLGIAYHYAGRYADAARAYQHAADLPEATSDMQKAAEELRAWRTSSQISK